MSPPIWAALLFILAMAFVVLELFVPSAGLLGFLAGCSLLASVAMVFVGVGFMAATYYLVGLAVLVPIVLVTLVKWWPHTPIGRRILNLPPGEEQKITGSANYEDWKSLVGRPGIAKTMMVPGGIVEVDGRALDATSDGTVIEKGEPVEVISSEGNYLVVRKADADRLNLVDSSSDVSSPPSETLIDDPFAD